MTVLSRVAGLALARALGMPGSDHPLYGPAVGAAIGGIVGVAQGLALLTLGRRIRRPYLWVPATALGGILAATVSGSLTVFIRELWIEDSYGLGIVVLAICGGVYGAVTGGALTWLSAKES